MRSRALLGSALVVFLAACGARSTLRTSTEGATGAGGSGPGSTGTGGSGPATGPGTSGVGASTGGSVNVACPALMMPEPLVELPALADFGPARDPLLQRLGQGDVLALMRRQAEEGPMGVMSSVSQVRLAPWESWPPVFGPALLTLSNSSNDPFVASVEPLGTLALGVELSPENNPSGCKLVANYGIPLDAPTAPNAFALPFDGTCDDVPIAIATAGNGTHFVANDMKLSNDIQPAVRSLVAHVLSAGGGMMASLMPVCASTRFVGDVSADETGFLFVHSASDSPPCIGALPYNPGRRLLLRRVEGTKEETSVLYQGVDDLVYTRILPRNGGSWVLYRESGASSDMQPPGMAMRLEGSSPTGDAFPVTSSDTDRMAAAAFGDGFVVAFVDSSDPSASNIVVRVYDDSGTLASEASFDTNGAWLNGDRLTLVASPSTRSFLVGWIGRKNESGSETFVRRFDCVDKK